MVEFYSFMFKNHNKYLLNSLKNSGSHHSVLLNSTAAEITDSVKLSFTEFPKIWLVKSQKTVGYRTFNQHDWFKILNRSRDFTDRSQQKNVILKNKSEFWRFVRLFFNTISINMRSMRTPDRMIFKMYNQVIWRELSEVHKN